MKKKDFICKDCSIKKTKLWNKEHPNKHKEYQERWRGKQIILCRYCNKQIPNENRGRGIVFCSDKCRENMIYKHQKLYRQKIYEWFKGFKEEQGCSICGYNKCGDALVYHHINPEDKERRIEMKHLYSGSNLIFEELNKCILLCKNCHAEIHYIDKKMKENGMIL